jgi:hypothetical protein
LSFKNNDPNAIDGLHPVHFLNYPTKKPTGKKLSFVKIVFSKSVTKNHEFCYISGGMEAAIKLVMVHETILVDLKIEEQVKTARDLAVVKKKSLTDLVKPQS